MSALIAALKSLAAVHKAIRLTESELIALLITEFQIEMPANAIARALKSQTLQFNLADRNAFIFQGRDGLFRLIDRTPVSNKTAAERIKNLPDDYACAYCGLKETRCSKPELVTDRDSQGQRLKTFVHPQCSVCMRRQRQQAKEFENERE